MPGDGLIKLVWDVDAKGYELVTRPATGVFLEGDDADQTETVITRVGGKTERYECDLLEHSIYSELANSAKDPDIPGGVLGFVNKWGLLTLWPEPPLETFLRGRDSLVQAMVIGASKGPAHLLDLLEKHEPGGLGRLHPCFDRRGRSLPRFYIRVHTLLQFCALEYLQTLAGGIDAKPCKNARCGKLLPLPKIGRPKTYCNAACQMAAFRDKHRDEINKARREKRAADRPRKART